MTNNVTSMACSDGVQGPICSFDTILLPGLNIRETGNEADSLSAPELYSTRGTYKEEPTSVMLPELELAFLQKSPVYHHHAVSSVCCVAPGDCSDCAAKPPSESCTSQALIEGFL